MKETNEPGVSTWKSPLKGWRWLAGWGVLIASLAAIARMVLGLTTDTSDAGHTALPWLLSISLALALVIFIGVLVRCFSSGRNFRRLLFGLACLAGLIGLFYAEEDVRGRLGWARFKARWESRGEKFDFTAFIPPTVADERNFAMTPVVVTAYAQVLDRNGNRVSPQDTNVVNRLKMPLDSGDGGPTNGIGNWQKAVSTDLEPWQRYYRNLALSTNLFPVAPQPQTPAADVLLALSKYDATIEELRGAAALPASRFPLNYSSEEPFAILLPHLASAKGCAVVLRLRALAELEAGQSEKALADIKLALRLTETIRSEPFLITHLVRIAMLQLTMQAVWEGLASHHWTDAQLSDLDQQLGGLDFVAGYQTALRSENACQVASTEFLRQHPSRFREYLDSGETDPFRFPDALVHLIPSGWYYQNEVSGSRFILERFLPIGDSEQRTFSCTLAREAEDSLRKIRQGPYSFLCRIFLPGLTNIPRKFAWAQAAVNLARTACALERHRLAHGRLPGTLDALAPQFMAKVPHDPIAGRPLHYHPTDDGHFVLYSVGWNEKDEGGIVAFTSSGSVDLDNGDWVWRYPDSPKP